jgi:hypothetical protein
MAVPIPECPVHHRAIEMIRSGTPVDDRLDREPSVAECHSCKICQLAREFAYLRSEEAGGRVSRRRHDSEAIWVQLNAEVIKRDEA